MAKYKQNAEQTWEKWTIKERAHFLKDHKGNANVNLFSKHWYQLPKELKDKIREHVGEGSYEEGGNVSSNEYSVKSNQYIPYGSNMGKTYYYVANPSGLTINKHTGKVYRGKEMNNYKFETEVAAQKYADELNSKMKNKLMADGGNVGFDTTKLLITKDPKEDEYAITNKEKTELYVVGGYDYVLQNLMERGISREEAKKMLGSAVKHDGFAKMKEGGNVTDNYKKFDLNEKGNFSSKIGNDSYEIIYRDDKTKLYDLFKNGKKISSNKNVRALMSFEKGGSVDIDWKETLAFFKSGSHRTADKIKQTGIPYISLYNLNWGPSAATQMLATPFSQYEKVKDIKGVSPRVKKLPAGQWFSRGENKEVDAMFREEFPEYYAKGGAVRTENDFVPGRPVVFYEHGTRYHGEVVSRGGNRKAVSLWPDDNYSGNEERIVIPDWSKVVTPEEDTARIIAEKDKKSGLKAWDVKYHTKEQMKKRGSVRGSMTITVKAKDRAEAVAIAKKEAGKEWSILSTCKPSKMNVEWLEKGGNVEPEKRYKVYKIGRKYGMSGRRELLGKNLSLDEARRMVNSYPDSSRSMVIFTSMAEGGNVGDVDSISKEYYELVDTNNHSEAALLLANHFGTEEEQETLLAIQKRSQHSISSKDQRERDAILNKYHPFVRSHNRLQFGSGGNINKKLQEEYANLNYRIQSADRGWIEKNSEKYEEMITELTKLHKKLYGTGRISKLGDGGGLSETQNGNYLNIYYSADAMYLTLTPEGAKFVKESREEGKADVDIMYELFEDIRANSDLRWDNDLGESGYGMTSAPGVIQGYSEDGEGDNVWYFGDYVIRSEIDDLMNKGKLTLTGVNNSFEQGGNINSEIDLLEQHAKKVEGEISMSEATLNSIREKINSLKAKQIVDDVQSAIREIGEKSSMMPWQKTLSDDEVSFVISAVNRYGNGEHPYIDYKNWTSLKFAYVKEVLNKLNAAPEHLSEEGLKVKDSVMKKFNVGA